MTSLGGRVQLDEHRSNAIWRLVAHRDWIDGAQSSAVDDPWG
jgi:hypothetical protein